MIHKISILIYKYKTKYNKNRIIKWIINLVSSKFKIKKMKKKFLNKKIIVKTIRIYKIKMIK